MLLTSYVWAYWNYKSASDNKDYSIRFGLTKSQWRLAHSEFKDALNTVSTELYKVVITRLTNFTLNKSDSLVFQTGLVVLLLTVQIAELFLIRPHGPLALVYYTFVASMLAIVFGLTLTGAAVAIACLSFKSWYSPSHCEFVSKFNYWY